MNINRYIDHTILKPESSKEAVLKVCEEARTHEFFSVCVNPYYIPVVKEALEGSIVKVCAVVGFPLGASVKEVKAFETAKAIEAGADEIDMVINIAALKNGELDVVLEDIKAVKAETAGKALLKVIIESCLLTDEEKVKACELSVEAGAEFVKTSTGFSTGGATADDIALMRKTVGPKIGVKASGGVRDFETAMAMVNAGATRIGASASVAIATHQEATGDGY
ncbi:MULTISPECIES: deoxyribose-phosphate aldolase [unclassified Fusibacter]|uniref:deoxyribose-phosphate aldolase n=1 Tax=unclassified Fusibacter TaxID=2624464 RepID=UPI0010122B3B|nr:deoxyribose-phosphate aldolase [Fusibacter sp. A1]MCK8058256.1 deoxyribose-phosphate aldolase [Fusibacter sp. A2]NPE20839.1 deoxyribose-phosphate aldolase [Fusibacter sp. A1]RXV63044.1 deoxyribose-phosphate aldolase [Fusibacter sp. A1]